jgi:hypothetical protein
MRTTITLDDALFERAALIAGDNNASSLLTKALEMMISAEGRKRLLKLSGGRPDFKIPGRDSRTSHPDMAAEDKTPYTP